MGQHPACVCGIVREQHISQLTQGKQSPLQAAFEYSDGMGNVVVKKVQAEPEQKGQPLRWIANGKTILNNKGKPVKQYEPYFSSVGHHFEEPKEEGVTPIIYYDAVGRMVRTEMPDGSYSRVEFSPWHVKTFDANDTAFDPAEQNHSDWYQRRTDPNHPRFAEFNSTENTRAANLVKIHANTPAITILDSLGRDVIAIAHNRIEDTNGTYEIDTKKYRDEYYTTYTKLDAEGKPLWIRDALNHLVMQYITPPKDNNDTSDTFQNDAVPAYDIAGNLLFQHSMDAGDRWTINDAAGKPMFAWDVYQANKTANEQKRLYSTEYDALHRPIALKLKIDDKAAITVERYEYQDSRLADGSPNPQKDYAKQNNLLGQLVKHYDPSGLITTIALDFKGSPLEIHRQLVSDNKSSVTDWNTDPQTKLETEIFEQLTEYDALKRMTRLYNWHRGIDSNVAVYEPQYSERGTLTSETLLVKAKRNIATTGKRYDTDANTQTNIAIEDISYDAKGQRQTLKLGNGVITTYTYDPETFRLVNLHTARQKTETCSADFSSVFDDSRIIQDLHYCYDPVGNITEIQDAAFRDIFFQNQKIEPINRYQYDALYRLISATGRENGALTGAPENIESTPLENQFPCIADNAFRNYTQIYQYDPVGNIQQMRHEAGSQGSWTRHYQYAFDDLSQAASNRLWRTWQGDDDWDGNNANNKVTYTYDSHGSMLNLANTPDDFHLQWDHRDMIAAINLGNGFAYYQYDAGKQRTRKWIDRNIQKTDGNTQNIKEERVYLGGVERYRRWVNDVLTQEIETLHLFDGKQRLLMVDQIDDADLGKRDLYRYILSNHLGSAIIELDEIADIISYEEYHPYGTSSYRAGRNAAEVQLKRYRYTGKERDEESGFSYHGARYYTAWLGRWSSSDPIGIADGINTFAYVGNRPISAIDSTGTADEGVTKITEWLQAYVNSVPEDEWKVLSQKDPEWASTAPNSRGTRYHTVMEAAIEFGWENKHGADIERVVSELHIDASGNLVAVSTPPGAARTHGTKRTADIGILKEGMTRSDIAARIKSGQTIKATDVLEIMLDYKTGNAKLKDKQTMEALSGVPYEKLAKKGNCTRDVEIALKRIGNPISTTVESSSKFAKTKELLTAVSENKFVKGTGTALGVIGKATGVLGTATAAVDFVNDVRTGNVTSGVGNAATVLEAGAALAGSTAAASVIGAFGTGYTVGTVLNDHLVGALIDKASPGSGAVGDWYYRNFLK